MYLSRIASEQNKANAGKLTLKLGVSVVLFCSFGLIILNLLPETLYLKLLGNGFKGIKTVVLFYSPAVIFTALYLILSNYFTGRGEARLVMMSNLLGLLLTLVLCPWLVGIYHLKGAAISAILIYIVMSFSLIVKFFKTLQ
jgi:O-antigen/teichoic acid export membrane protein